MGDGSKLESKPCNRRSWVYPNKGGHTNSWRYLRRDVSFAIFGSVTGLTCSSREFTSRLFLQFSVDRVDLPKGTCEDHFFFPPSSSRRRACHQPHAQASGATKKDQRACLTLRRSLPGVQKTSRHKFSQLLRWITSFLA